ncbi:abortive infection protein [Enterobacter cloacae]|uniref:abortive infection protein n=1 Tax=Enterobacter cloacae TaxID=550 RepID=UPI001ACBC4F8|nr:abortive infection protein [Enterobacter cloacae]HBW2765494.1 abortive infection protein [Klebsiella pneumoniae]HDS5356288.1 abortive infection protein [Enterobacter kobei]MCU6414163.1 abortive infection protein [Enterobacter cloacae]MDM6891054.1 abortive infection protein [Enterobacter cloacae]HAZ4815799.1 abortive infection protein [Enterobacter cloacae]
MDFLNDTEGTVLFPFQTEIAFVLAIITTAKDLSVSAWGHIGQKQYWSACLCILLLMAYVGLCAAVVWAVVPWLKAFFMAKYALSPFWFTPVKSLLLRGIGKMAATICRKFTLLK